MTDISSEPVAPPVVAVPASRKTGRVKFFDSRKGFGFILPDDGTRDVFVGINMLPNGVKTLTPDQLCSFVPHEGRKGPIAKSLQLL